VLGKYVICELWINYIAVQCPLDIIFALDESQSVGRTNYRKMTTFVSQLVGTLDVKSAGGAHVGVLTYSTIVNKIIYLEDQSTFADLQAYISNLTYRPGSRNTAAALNYVRIDMLNSSAAERSDVPNVVIIMTGGGSNDKQATKVCKMLKLFVCMRQLYHCDCVSKVLILHKYSQNNEYICQID